MNRQSWTTVDKSDWGDGEWQSEPDKIVWVDDATNLDCMIHRGPLGALCGYVGVPKAHALYGKDSSEADAFDVHGGVTYANECDPEATAESGICHVPADGRDGHVWWIGFDCAQTWDIAPAFLARQRMLEETFPDLPKMPDDFPGMPRSTYKNVAYVAREVERLAKQVAAVG